MAVGLVRANLATMAVESFLHGMFLVLSAAWFYLHISRSGSSSKARTNVRLITPVSIAGVAIFASVIAHWACTVTRFFKAFLTFNSGKDPELFYSELFQITELIKTGFLIATLVISDLMFVYRLWIIWNRNYYVTILPILSILGLLVSGAGTIHQLSLMSVGSTVFSTTTERWNAASYSFTIATNVYSSAMIAWRVWRSYKILGYSYGGEYFMRIMVIIIEGALIYTAYVIIAFVSYKAGSNLQYTFVDTLCQIAGISFMVINVRIGLGWALQYSSTPNSSRLPARRETARYSFAVRPVAVDISQVVLREDDTGRPIKRLSSDFAGSV